MESATTLSNVSKLPRQLLIRNNSNRSRPRVNVFVNFFSVSPRDRGAVQMIVIFSKERGVQGLFIVFLLCEYNMLIFRTPL